jgi:hypothetical protein
LIWCSSLLNLYLLQQLDTHGPNFSCVIRSAVDWKWLFSWRYCLVVTSPLAYEAYGSRDRIPPGYRVVVFKKKKNHSKWVLVISHILPPWRQIVWVENNAIVLLLPGRKKSKKYIFFKFYSTFWLTSKSICDVTVCQDLAFISDSRVWSSKWRFF